MENFQSVETTAKNAWSSYHAEKNVYRPLHHRIVLFFYHQKSRTYTWHAKSCSKSLYWILTLTEYNTLNPHQVTAVDCSDYPIHFFSKIIQWKYLTFSFWKYFDLFGAVHIEKELLKANGHLIAGIGLGEILGDTSNNTAGLQTSGMDVFNIQKAWCSAQLSAVSIYHSRKIPLSKSEQTLHIARRCVLALILYRK